MHDLARISIDTANIRVYNYMMYLSINVYIIKSSVDKSFLSVLIVLWINIGLIY